MGFSQKEKQNLKIELPYNPAVLLLDIYPKECKSAYNRDTCTVTFIAALFTIAKLWNQHRCPSTDEWIKKMWYIYIIEYYSAIKKKLNCYLQEDGTGNYHDK
jgi:hypothetical protein